MRKLLYIKYQDYRKKEYDVRTKICSEEGRRLVIKEAAFPEAEAHILRMAAFYEVQREAYEKAGLELNRCRKEEDHLVFEYLEGENLQIRLDSLLQAKRTEEAKDLLRTCFRKLAALPSELQEGVRTLSAPANLDFNLDNIILTGGRWILLDYEWTSGEKTELLFVIWRTLDNYRLHNEEGAALILEDLFQEYGIEEVLQERFREMELSFQEKVTDPWSLKRYTEKYHFRGAAYPMLQKKLEDAARERKTAEETHQREKEQLEARIRQVESDYQNSTCWKITAPVRAAGKLLGKEKKTHE